MAKTPNPAKAGYLPERVGARGDILGFANVNRWMQLMVNHEHYTYRVVWSEEDQEFVGLCAEFPSLSYLDETLPSALEGIVSLVADVVADMIGNQDSIPEPISERTYSGKFQVRIPPEQHRMLAIKAAEEGVSLNRYISSKLI